MTCAISYLASRIKAPPNNWPTNFLFQLQAFNFFQIMHTRLFTSSSKGAGEQAWDIVQLIHMRNIFLQHRAAIQYQTILIRNF